MDWLNFEIKDVWRTHARTVRGSVEIQFEEDRPDKTDDDWPVSPTIEVTAYIKHDPANTYEEVERALLREALRLLTAASEQIGDATPQDIRSAVDKAQTVRERRLQEESDAQMAKALKGIGNPSAT